MIRLSLRSAALVLALLCSSPLAVRADEALDQIQEAVKAYNKGDYATAITALDSAAVLVRQKRTERWQSLLPEPLSGWKAEAAQSTTVSPSVLGGGTSISRSYYRGADTVEISLVLDSPLLQSVSGLLSNPLFTNNDIKVVVIDGRKVTVTKSENSYQVLIANKVMLVIKGGPTVGDDVLKAYLATIKFAELEKNAQ